MTMTKEQRIARRIEIATNAAEREGIPMEKPIIPIKKNVPLPLSTETKEFALEMYLRAVIALHIIEICVLGAIIWKLYHLSG